MAGVDVHQHLWPRAFTDALSRRTAVPYLDGSILHAPEGASEVDLGAHELEARLALLDRFGIDTAIVSLQPTLGLDAVGAAERDRLVETWEDGVFELVDRAGGRILPLAVDRPRAGFVGVSVGADRLDDLAALAPTLDGLRGAGFLFVHPVAGSPPNAAPPWWSAIVDYTSQMQRAYLSWLAGGQERWPDVDVVFAILAGGAPIQLERLASRGVDVRSVLYPNVFFDTASYGRRALELCVETFGVEQVVYGSDVPVVDPEPTFRAVRGFGESVEQIVMCDNPGRLLK